MFLRYKSTFGVFQHIGGFTWSKTRLTAQKSSSNSRACKYPMILRAVAARTLSEHSNDLTRSRRPHVERMVKQKASKQGRRRGRDEETKKRRKEEREKRRKETERRRRRAEE